MSLRKNLSEVEQDTQEAYLHRREFVKLLVEKITVDRNEDERAKVDIIYRFGPPLEEPTSIVAGVQNSLELLPRQDCSSEATKGELHRGKPLEHPISIRFGRRLPLERSLPPSNRR